MKSVVEWILYIGFALLVFYVVRNGIPFIDLQDLPDAIIDSVSTHEQAELIPAKTMAGSEVCNDGIDVNIICVELLQYEGFRDSGIDSIIEGLEDGIRKYPLTEKELTVGWVGFGLTVPEFQNKIYINVGKFFCIMRVNTKCPENIIIFLYYIFKME